MRGSLFVAAGLALLLGAGAGATEAEAQCMGGGPCTCGMTTTCTDGCVTRNMRCEALCRTCGCGWLSTGSSSRPDGSRCGTDCLGRCASGTCDTTQPWTAGTSCGSGATDCSMGDVCDDSGACLPNDVAAGTECEDGDADACTGVCDGAGSCMSGARAAGSPCGALGCMGSCGADGSCTSPLCCADDVSCHDDDTCTDDQCDLGLGVCYPVPICGVDAGAPGSDGGSGRDGSTGSRDGGSVGTTDGGARTGGDGGGCGCFIAAGSTDQPFAAILLAVAVCAACRRRRVRASRH